MIRNTIIIIILALLTFGEVSCRIFPDNHSGGKRTAPHKKGRAVLESIKKAPPQNGMNLNKIYTETPYFLLPDPLSSLQIENKEINAHTLKALFSSPLMDRNLIESVGSKMETESRKLLLKRQKALLKDFCAMEDSRKHQALSFWEHTLNQQYALWLRIHTRFEDNLNYKLKYILKKEDLEQIQVRRRTVKLLQKERQQLVLKSWQNLFRQLVRKSPKICSRPRSESPRKSGGAETGLPRERLFLPYYLSLYRFYLLFTPTERASLIMELKISP